jgi:hypothetical protein
MNFRAQTSFRAGSFARLEQLLVPLLITGATNGANAVLAESQALVPVDTGALKVSGGTRVEWTGQRVTGYITYGAYYAAYVEFGTGARGAGSAGAGPYPYKLSWPGMLAQPYCRPALDSSRAAVLDAFRAALTV